MKHVVFIGGGFSSLCLAALMVKDGRYKVSVVERSGRIGGYAQELNFGGYRFPMGPRYLWDFGPGDPALRFFEELGILQSDDFHTFDPAGFDEVFIGKDLAIKVPMGWDAYQCRLEEEFPREREGICRFFESCRKIDQIFRCLIAENVDYRGYGSIPQALWHIGSPFVSAATILTTAGKTLQSEFYRCNLSARLQTILSAHLAIVCEVPKDVSLVGYAVATLNYHRGSYYPKKNIESMVAGLIEFIKSRGGHFHLNSTVTAIKEENNSATHVKLGSDVIDGDIFVSNIDPSETYRIVFPNVRSVGSPKYTRSNSLLSHFMGCEIESTTKFPFGRNQKWIIESDKTLQKSIFDNKSNTDRMIPEYLYVNSPSACAISDAGCGPNKQSATVTAFAPGSAAFWKTLSRTERSDYREQKKEAIEEAIAKCVWSDLRRSVKVSELITPSDYENQLGAPEGHIYGRRFCPRDLFIDRVPFQSKLANLYFCSAFTNQPGLASCIRGAEYLYKILSKP